MFIDFGLPLYYLAWIAVLVLYFALYLGIIKICSVWELSLATIVKVTCVFIILIPLSCLAFSFSDTAICENHCLLIFIRYVLPIAAAFVMFVVLKHFSNCTRPENKKYEQDSDGRMIIQPERYLAIKDLWKDLAKSAQIANLFLIALS